MSNSMMKKRHFGTNFLIFIHSLIEGFTRLSRTFFSKTPIVYPFFLTTFDALFIQIINNKTVSSSCSRVSAECVLKALFNPEVSVARSRVCGLSQQKDKNTNKIIPASPNSQCHC
jgi:hypothetical protein